MQACMHGWRPVARRRAASLAALHWALIPNPSPHKQHGSSAALLRRGVVAQLRVFVR